MSKTAVWRVVLLGVLMGVWPAVTQAQNYTNRASGNWSVAGSWSTSIPAAGGGANHSLVFTNSGAVLSTNNLGDAGLNFNLNQLVFSTAVGPLTIVGSTGNNLVFTNNAATLPRVRQFTSTNLTFNHVLNLAANTLFDGSGRGLITLNSNVFGAGALVVNLTNFNSSGNLSLVAANDFAGGLVISNGAVLAKQVASVGPGTVSVVNGSLFLQAANATYGNNFTIAGTGTGSGALRPTTNTTLTGTLTLSNNATITHAASTFTMTENGAIQMNNYTLSLNPNSGTNLVNGVVSGAGALTVSGSGWVILTGANDFTGGMTINAGRLQFDNAAALPASGFISNNVGGALVVMGPYSTLGEWITAGRLATNSGGSLALVADNSEALGMSVYAGLSIGAAAGRSVTFSGSLFPGAAGYYFGGGGGTITSAVVNLFAGSGANVTIGRGGGGTTVLPFDNDASGILTNASGNTLWLGTGGASGWVSATQIVNQGTLVVNRSDSFTNAARIISAGAFYKTNSGELVLTGFNTLTNNVFINGGTLTLGATSSNLFGAQDVRLGNVAGATGMIQQVGGFVSATGGGNGLLLGANGGAGYYLLNGGTLNALTTGNRGLILGVNTNSTGVFNMVTGVVTGNQMQVARSDAAAAGSIGYFYQAGGSVGLASLTMAGGSAANSSNSLAVLAISNGTFWATSFGSLASGNNSTGQIYIGQGAQVKLGAFPTTRGANSYSEVLFDGGSLGPVTASANYMSNLTHAFITTNGATLDVDFGRDSTMVQPLEDAAGHSGALTKAGHGGLTLTGANSYSGGTVINGGCLTFGAGALPGTGNVLINSGGALAAAGVFGTVNGWLGSGRLLTTSSGAIAIVGDNSEAIDFTAGGFSNLFLGAASGTTGTFTGTLTGFDTTYRLGGGGGTLNYPAVIGAGSNVVIGAPGGVGTVVFTNINTYTAATVFNAGALNINADAALGVAPGSPANNLVFNGNAGLQFAATFALDANRTILLNSGATANLEPLGTTNLIPGLITGAGGLNKLGSGVLVLSGPNNYGGNTTNSAGVLALGADNVLGTGTLVLNGGYLSSDSPAARSLNNNLAFLADANLGVAGLGDLTLSGSYGDLGTTTRTLTISNSVTTLNNILTNAAGLVKAGPGTLVLGAANTYGGTTLIKGGTLQAGANNVLPLLSTLIVGESTNYGTFNLGSFSQSITSLLSRSTSDATTNRITISAGQTLTINGDVTIGTNLNTSSTALAMDGGGNLVINKDGGFVRLGVVTGTDQRGKASLDLSGLAYFSMDLGTGTLSVAYSGDNSTAYPNSLILAGSNLLKAATITVGGSSLGSMNSLVLGPGSNVFNVATLNLGSGSRDGGQLLFNGSGGSLMLRDTNGTGRVTVNILINNTTTGYQATNLVNLTGHYADLLIGTLTMGDQNRNGVYTNALFFDQGLMDITNLVMGVRGRGVNLVSIGGGVVNLGGVSLSGTATNTGTLNITGGVVTLGGEITNNVGGRGVVTLNGGTLNMQGYNLGTASGFISNLNFQAGTLQNVVEINGGLAPLVKTTAGTLLLDTANTYTGGTIISNGTLLVNNATGLATGSGAVTLYNGGTLQGTGAVAAVVVNSLGRVVPGNSIGTLTMGGLTMNAGSFYDYEFNLGHPQTNDQIVVLGDVAIGGGAFNFYEEGGTTAWTTNGTYFLIRVDGLLSGLLEDLSVNTAPSKKYTFGTNGVWITVDIADASFYWTGLNAESSYWTSNDNWATPPSAGVPLVFAGSTRLINTNDFAANTKFAGITFTTNANAFVLEGNAVNLTSAVENNSPNVQTLNLPLVLDGFSRPFNSYSNSLVVNGVISEVDGSWSLLKNGAYGLTLSASNLYTGGTFINAGTLVANNINALGSGAVTITNGMLQLAQSLTVGSNLTGNAGAFIDLGSYTLTINQGGNSTFAGAITNAGILAKSGTGTLTLTGTNTYTGGTLITAGVLQVGDGAGADGVVVGNISNDASLIFANANAQTFGGQISGSGALKKTATGTLTLSGANSYSNGTTIAGGTLQISADNNLGAPGGGLTFTNGATLDVGAGGFTLENRAIALQTGGGVMNIAGTLMSTNVVSGSGPLVKQGGGTLTLAGANTFTGALSNNAGIVAVGGNYALGRGRLVLNNGQLAVANGGGWTVTNQISLLANSVMDTTGGSLTLSNVISGGFGLNLISVNPLTLAGANTYSGGTVINTGIVIAANASALGGGSVGLTNSLLQLAQNLAISNLTGDASAVIDVGANVLTVNQGISGTFAGLITNSGSLAKGGTGTLTLSGLNTYGGLTTIRQGTLQMGVAGALPSGGVLFLGDGAANGGVLDLNGFSQAFSALVTPVNSQNNNLALTNSVINLVPGQTLSVVSTANSNAVNVGTGTHLIMTGGGTFDINAPQGGLLLWGRSNNVAAYLGLDVSQLDRFSANVSNLVVGFDSGSPQASRLAALTLATNNVITANAMYVGYSTQDGNIKGQVFLGQSNTLNVANLTLGHFKGFGTMTFAPGLINPVLTLAGTGGTDRANVYIGRLTGGTGVNAVNYLMITNTGAAIYANLDQLVLASLDVTPSGVNGPTGVFTFDNGIVDVNTAVVGRSLSGVTAGLVNGVLTQNGGVLNVNHTFVIAQRLGSGGSITGTVNFAGGVANSYAPLLGGRGISTLNLLGGTLDLHNNALGDGANGFISNLVFQSGVLQNVAELNGGAALVKTGSGTLTLAGVNTHTGETVPGAGELLINSAQALQNSTLNYTNGSASFGPASTSYTLGGLAGTQDLALTNASGAPIAVTFGGNGLPTTYSGVLSRGGSVTKTGAGLATFSGASTHSGGTTINGGTLALTGSGAPGSGPLNIAAGATLDVTGVGSLALAGGQSLTNRGTVMGGLIINYNANVSGGGSFAGGVTNLAGGLLTPGVGGATNFFQNISLSGGSTNLFWLGPTYATHDMSVVTNSLTGDGTSPLLQLDLFSYVQNPADVGRTIVLYQNLFTGPGTFDGTNQWFKLSNLGGPDHGLNLLNGTTFLALGSGGATNAFNIRYDFNSDGTANDIMLTVVPEPATLNLLVLFVLGCGWTRLRRRLAARGP
jgi:autotransporter-associated beta strand protein